MRRIRYLPYITKKRVLIVDVGADHVNCAIPKELDTLWIPVRGEYWYINLKIAVFAFTAFHYYLRGRIGLRGLYVVAVRRAVKASLLLTFVDNNNWDIGLLGLNEFRVLCIQNGYRDIKTLEGKKFDIYCAINEQPKSVFDRFNVSTNYYCVTGSLRLAIFYSRFWRPKLEKSLTPVVMLPSQFRSVDKSSSVFELTSDVIRAQSKLCQWMARLVDEGICKVIVCFSSRDLVTEAQEKSYFTDIFGSSAEFRYRSGDEWSTYRAMSESNLVVGIGSTVILEAMELNIPHLFGYTLCNEQTQEIYANGVKHGSVNTISKDSSYTQFRKQTKNLLSAPIEEHQAPRAISRINRIIRELADQNSV